jgi:thioredoxin 1
MEQINKDNFNDKISTGVVVVDVYAGWCGPCKILMPTLEKLSDEFTIYKINMEVEEDKDFVKGNYNITSIPTLIFFKDGVEYNRTTGNQTEEAIKEIINQA